MVIQFNDKDRIQFDFVQILKKSVYI